MDFELDDDQLALQPAAGELLDGFASSAQVRVVVDGGGGFDSKLWAAMVEQGWLGIALPEAQGGLGLSWVEVTVLLEQLGRHVGPAPFLQQVVALDLLARAGSSRVEHVVGGAGLAAIAFAPVAAEQIGDEWRLTGTTEPVVYGPSADMAVVRSDDAVFVVDLAALEVRPEPAMDRTREVGWLRLRDTPAERLGRCECQPPGVGDQVRGQPVLGNHASVPAGVLEERRHHVARHRGSGSLLHARQH